MPIPPNITKDHILQAISKIDEKRYDPIYESRNYVLSVDGKYYPPKYVVRLANRFANGHELDSSSYISLEANRLLERLGFTITRIPSREAERHLGRKTSLTGLIMREWIGDGRPSLTWDELLRRTVEADQELENMGLNPAPVFRRHRHEGNQLEMQRYIGGFYEYKFSPNYNSRKRARNLGAKAGSLEEQSTTHAPIAVVQNEKSDTDLLITLSKSVESILERMESRSPNRDVASWINDLERKGHIPKQISFRMHSIRLTRNRVVHDGYVLSPAERAAVNADWATIEEWWKRRESK